MASALIIAGSPRRGGNSDNMAEIARQTLQREGAAAEVIYLRDLDFAPCQACGACNDGEGCRLEDDLAGVYPKLLTAEMLIIAAPVYFQSLGALPKAFIDRMQCFWAIRQVCGRPVITDSELRRRRRTMALLCGGTDFPDTFACAEKTIKLFGLTLEAKYAGGVFFPKVDAPGDLLRDPANLPRLEEAIEKFGRK